MLQCWSHQNHPCVFSLFEWLFVQLHTPGLSQAPPMAVHFKKTFFLTLQLQKNIPMVLGRILLCIHLDFNPHVWTPVWEKWLYHDLAYLSRLVEQWATSMVWCCVQFVHGGLNWEIFLLAWVVPLFNWEDLLLMTQMQTISATNVVNVKRMEGILNYHIYYKYILNYFTEERILSYFSNPNVVAYDLENITNM